MFDASTGEHIYISTACLHDVHRLCRLACRWCAAECLCMCHRPKENHRVHYA